MDLFWQTFLYYITSCVNNDYLRIHGNGMSQLKHKSNHFRILIGRQTDS